MDWTLTLAGLFIGFVVGLTGMGGGALMTPVLVLFFGIPPLAAVSSDLVVSAVTRPVGALVHLRRGSVNLPLVGWLCVGSVPCAFLGVLISRALGGGSGVQEITKLALGAALLVAATGLIVKSYLRLLERKRRREDPAGREAGPAGPVQVRPLPTVLVGAVGGVIVGMTSVGSGSLIIIALLFLYPGLSAAGIVGTDLAQAVPLVISAALGHLLFGDFQFDLTLALLIGTLPGVYLGARMSAHAPDGVVRRALALVLLASGLKLLNVSNAALVVVVAVVLVAGPALWMWARTLHGLPARSHFLSRGREREKVRQ